MTDAQIGAQLRQILTDEKMHPAHRALVFSHTAIYWPKLHSLITDPSIIGEREYVGDFGFDGSDRGTVFGNPKEYGS